MQKISLELNNYNFYCPATGQQVLFTDDFNPSPALLFSYLEGNMTLDNATEEIEALFNSALEQTKNTDKYTAFDIAFKKLINEKLAGSNNYILFTINSNRDVFHMAFDMNYAEVEEGTNKDSIEANLPDINELYDNFIASQGKMPAKDGYAVFTSDELGVGAFHFCDDGWELTKLAPSIIFMDALTEGYSIYDPKILEELYCLDLHFYTDQKSLKEFQKEFNSISAYQIDFIGKVEELFDKNNEFAKSLIEKFGKDPNQHEEEYLRFLKEYYVG